MRRILTVLATTAMAAGMVFAQAQSPANHPNHRAMAREQWQAALNLNDTQKAEAKVIFGQARQEAQPLRAQLKQNREALEIAVKTNDKAQIAKLSAAEGQVIGKLMTVRTEAMAKFYQDLTPAQRLKADQLYHQHRMQRMEHSRTRS